MRRFFRNSEDKQGNDIIIQGDDFRHMKHALRLNDGDEVRIVIDGMIYICTLSFQEDRAIGHIIDIEEKSYESPLKIHLYQGILKGDHMDFVLQKSTELGITKISPLETERTIVRLNEKKYQKRKKRYEKIVEEAAKQSKRTVIPEIGNLCQLKDIQEELIICGYEKDQSRNLRQIIKEIDREEIAIVIGPEGGFSAKEIDLLKGKGAKIADFGPRILRGETAPLFLISVLQYELGDL
ncbi:MAG: RsmE family RNA methyltransferase [Tissierellia bacterium]|nr:RsmE family RNA methyltransferase [Tissierellia bacterium]